jgi:hypothetical protein
MFYVKLIYFSLLFLLSFKVLAMDVKHTELIKGRPTEAFCSHTFSLYGTIKSGDSKKVISIIEGVRNFYGNKKCNSGKPYIDLESTGGSVEEAILLAKYIRNIEASTNVSFGRITDNGEFVSNSNGRCLSSCIILLAAGISRNVSEFSIVGIHRPYLTQLSPNSTPSDVSRIRSKTSLELKELFETFDINPTLVDDMMGIPPEEMKVLSKDELRRYRLSVDDANYNEVAIAKTARVWNLTSAEFRKRDIIADERCKSNASDSLLGYDWNCRNSIILNISKSDFTKREIKAKEICKNYDGDSKQECWRNILVLGK